jgi:3-oxoacyl-[acyl-carrier protein] reductase
VALLARDGDVLERAAGSLGAPDGALLTVSADLTDAESVREAVARVVGWHGGVNIVVNNAGPQLRPAPIAESDDEALLMALDTKLVGMWRVSKAVIPSLPDDGTGRVINIAGVTAMHPVPGGSITGITNTAVRAFTKYLALELAGRRVLVNSVSPGFCNTDGWLQRLAAMGEAQGRSADEVQKGMTDGLGIALGRWSEEHEIADAVAFLASDQASYITGQTIGVDGGLDKAVV